MKVCTYTNLCAAGALFLVLGFSACAGNKPAPAASPAASEAPPASAAPAASAPSGADSAAPDDTGAAPDQGADDSAGGEGSAPAAGKTKETRTTAVIAGFIKEHRKPFRACYDKAHKQLPKLKGNMTLHFVLDPKGNVQSAKLNIARSDIKAPLAVDCAIKVLKKLKFPPSSRGMRSEINYPFNFEPH